MQRKRQLEFTIESQSVDEEISANKTDENESENEQEHENASENNDEDDDDDNQTEADQMDMAGPSGLNDALEVKQPKKRKRGIIYISSIPKHMNVMILREMLDQYAKIDRVFLQPGKLPGKTSFPLDRTHC